MNHRSLRCDQFWFAVVMLLIAVIWLYGAGFLEALVGAP